MENSVVTIHCVIPRKHKLGYDFEYENEKILDTEHKTEDKRIKSISVSYNQTLQL